jgi:hypothetical protein
MIIHGLWITEFYEYMKNNACSEKHINNNLKAIMNFADNLEPTTTSFLTFEEKIKYYFRYQD